METVLQINGLTKRFGRRVVINNLNLSAYSGEVFGFLGPNGSGKTTTIKMIMGLLYMDAGNVLIGGRNVSSDFEGSMMNVGAIVENPELYRFMSGRENLRQYQRVRGGISDERVAEVVNMVGLSNRINEKVGRYSLGMKQRLGLAQAILHRPKVLILDEPTNGLDPSGIRDLRDILKYLAHKEGVGVFVSSHLLSEMELMCDRVGIIDLGRLIDVKPVGEFVRDLSQSTVQEIRYTVSESLKAKEILSYLGSSVYNFDDRGFTLSLGENVNMREINRTLVNADIDLWAIEPIRASLEDAFMALTRGQGQGGTQIG